jgi:hypothetical protein
VADFTASFSAGTTLEDWTDPADVARPSRINPTERHGFKRRTGSIGVEVVITARVDGVDGPLDSALDGVLFVAACIEYPTATPPALAPDTGQSSVQRFTPTLAGHYTFCVRHVEGDGSRNGGAVLLHLDVT